jgi:hypothetical protein
MARWRGTLRGLSLALDLATGGAVRGGEIVILEDFRLRRTFATILGADLDDEQDPLTAGLATSGNSYVGDTLFLGEEERREFLALFHSELPVTDSEQEDIDSLTADLAHRVTVLVHQAVEPQDLGLMPLHRRARPRTGVVPLDPDAVTHAPAGAPKRSTPCPRSTLDRRSKPATPASRSPSPARVRSRWDPSGSS